MIVKQKNILIIEDEVDSLERLVQAIREVCTSDYGVYGCTSLKAAKRYLQEHRCSLFLVDMVLKNEKFGAQSGYEFVEWLRSIQEYAYTPVICMAEDEKLREDAFKQLHCFGYVHKDADLSEIQYMVKQTFFYPAKEKSKKLCLKQAGVYIWLEQSQVVYLKADRNHVYVKRNQDKALELSYMPLSKLLKELPEEEMLLCSKGVAVNKRYVESIHKREQLLYLAGHGETIKLGRAFLKQIIQNHPDIRIQ